MKSDFVVYFNCFWARRVTKVISLMDSDSKLIISISRYFFFKVRVLSLKFIAKPFDAQKFLFGLYCYKLTHIKHAIVWYQKECDSYRHLCSWQHSNSVQARPQIQRSAFTSLQISQRFRETQFVAYTKTCIMKQRNYD